MKKAVVRPTADPKNYLMGDDRAATLPNRMNDCAVDVACALPGVIILVHGVNDLGVSYPAQEQGLCQGLNERLSRNDLTPAGYRLPPKERNDKLEADPDAVYYRRDGKGYSPVIPFYWGYREHFRKVQTDTPHGQYLDRHGNRLDKSGAQGGGPFANATSNLPDLWGEGFRPYGGVLNATVGTPTHPMHGGPDRRYMVLAAMRLAALVQAIRHHHKDETVTLIGHSQGCLLALLAQAFLDEEWGERPADCLILNHPPYGLEQPPLEWLQTFDSQQTTRARLTTLQNLVRVVTEKPHTEPPLAALEGGTRWGVCGPFWKAGAACRHPAAGAAAETVFAERDNRGKVYLYFCPEDLTVGLDNVIGIGSFGIPETVKQSGMPASVVTTVPALPTLGNRFFQRVFTMRQRDGAVLPVGDQPTTYCLREAGENFHAYAPSAKAADHRHLPQVGETRRITGEPLSPPCVPDLRCGEIAKGTLAVDPIEAAVAITNQGIGKRQEIIDDPRSANDEKNRSLACKIADPHRIDHAVGEILPGCDLKEIEQALNWNKAVEDSCRVLGVTQAEAGRLNIVRSETPNEARLRWQSTQAMENSYHSAIIANPEHSRHVHAFDVAIAQGESVTNPTFRELLVKLADWRVMTKLRPDVPAVLLKDVQALPFYADLPARVRKLTEANARYYTEGTLPLEVIPERPPKETVLNETLGRGAHPESLSAPKRGA